MQDQQKGEYTRVVAVGRWESGGGMWRSFMIRGILAGLLGLFALFWPSTAVELLITLVGVFCVVDGLTGLLGIFRPARRGAGRVAPLVGLGIGLVLLFWPDATVRTLLVVLGVLLLVIGISLIAGARQDEIQGADRNFMTAIGGFTAAVGLVLTLWPGSGVVAISWVIAIPALLVAVSLIFLALRLKRARERPRQFEV